MFFCIFLIRNFGLFVFVFSWNFKEKQVYLFNTESKFTVQILNEIVEKYMRDP
jgi:hypothetical protein